MLTMTAYMWIFFAFWLTSVSLYGKEVCYTSRVTAPLGSLVFLPCTFSSNGSNEWIVWTHQHEEEEAGVELVHLSSHGRVKFLDPRSGRVKAFPNQAAEWKYDIVIDELQESDMGSYYCKQNNKCLEVKVSGKGNTAIQPCYISTGVAGFILLCLVGSLCWFECVYLHNKRGALITVNETTQVKQEIHGSTGREQKRDEKEES